MLVCMVVLPGVDNMDKTGGVRFCFIPGRRVLFLFVCLLTVNSLKCPWSQYASHLPISADVGFCVLSRERGSLLLQLADVHPRNVFVRKVQRCARSEYFLTPKGERARGNKLQHKANMPAAGGNKISNQAGPLQIEELLSSCHHLFCEKISCCCLVVSKVYCLYLDVVLKGSFFLWHRL